MAFDAYFPKITLPSGESDIRKGDGLGMIINGKVMLVDAFDGGEATRGLIAWLKSNKVTQIDLAVDTHAHGDHYGGFKPIVNAGIPIKEFRSYHIASIRGGNAASREDSDNLLELIRWLQARDTRVLFVDHGSVLNFEDTTWKIYRDQPASAKKNDTNAWEYVNNGSLVLWSPELELLLGGDGPEHIKKAIAHFGAKVSGYDIAHHGNSCTESNAAAVKAAGCVVAWESCIERGGPGTTEWTEFGARRVVQQKIPVWMQDAPIYIHAENGLITFRQGNKTISKKVPYQGKGGKTVGRWVNDRGWKYQNADGSWAHGWALLSWSKGKDWFYFDGNGYCVYGWKFLKWSKGSNWFYFDPKSAAMRTGWVYDNGSWYYLDPETGAMRTGWVTYKGKRCYLEPLSDKTHVQGVCYVNRTAVIGGKTYSFDKDGYATESSASGTVSIVTPGKKVIDVSEFQPEDIDWTKLKAAGYAVIVRMGLRGSIKGTARYRKVGYDYHFKKYIAGIIAAGIPYSVYYFPTPLSDEEADQEADWIIMNVAGLNLSMPLWLDSERVDKGVANDISTTTRTRYLKRITDKLVAAGIPCGIYASTSWLNNQINMGELPQQVRDNTWCAQYADKCTYDGVYAMWQYYNRAKVPGIDDEVDISIVKRQFNMSCKKSAPKENAMTKDKVKVFPVTNPVKISNSGSDERGNYKGGTAGDNTGREWQIRDWYNRPWNCVLRHPDPEVRACLADLATKAANNNKIGYDQYQRETYWRELQKAGYDPSKITVACESDCSAGVIANIKAVGHILGRPELQNITCTYTGNMRSGLTAAGFACLTESKYLTSSAYLVAGDVLLNDKHHTATAVTNGVSAGTGEITASAMPLIKRGSKGAAVLQLQKLLNSKGYKLSEDSDFGPATEAAVKAFQKANHLETDGEVGPLTWAALYK